jgi:hypothetical protein
VFRREHIFICCSQGVSHAEWPKDNHEHATAQIGNVIYSPFKPMDIEGRQPSAKRVSKKKL